MGKELYNDLRNERISNKKTLADVGANLLCMLVYACDIILSKIRKQVCILFPVPNVLTKPTTIKTVSELNI